MLYPPCQAGDMAAAAAADGYTRRYVVPFRFRGETLHPDALPYLRLINARTLNQEEESLLYYNRNQFLPKPARSARPRAPRVSWWTVNYCNTIPITCSRKPCP
jgi:hypothetical protein